MLGLTGCHDRPTTIDPLSERSRQGQTLKLATDTAPPELLLELAASWSARTGGKVVIVPGDFSADADLALIAPSDLGAHVAANRLAAMPIQLMEATHPFRYDEIVGHYTNRTLIWKDRVYSLPIVSEGAVTIYRKDLLTQDPPRTWEGLIKTGSYPTLPKSARELDLLFHMIASSYDRKPVGRVANGSNIRPSFFSFDFDAETGTPRVHSAAFVKSAEILKALWAISDRTSANAVESLRQGKSRIGVVSLKELAELTQDTTLASKLGVVPLPGTSTPFDDEGKPQVSTDGSFSRVPLHGYGGLIGVVSAKSEHADAAWAFLADIAGPDRGSLEMISSGKWGAGVMRSPQLDARFRSRWYGYRLNHEETSKLIDCLREDLGTGIQNSRQILRTPNQRELSTLLSQALREMLDKNLDPATTLNRVAEEWKAVTGRDADWLRTYRTSLGL